MTKEFLNDDGKVPEVSERLIILVMLGVRTVAHCLRRDVGMGSRSHCLFGRESRSLDTSSVAGVKLDKLHGGCGGDG
jgi:hypothetical protein